jgi:SAM-dependent methyltransferase
MSRQFQWGRTSSDYAAWRPNYPAEFYDRAAAIGIGLPEQRILDLGTGVGFLAIRFAQRGAIVTGIDIAEGQIREARESARKLGLEIDFRVAPAEQTGLPDASCDAVTASQAWLYFDHQRAIPEVKRLLRPEGVLMLSHMSWLPREDEIARRSEELVLEFNPDWSAADWSGEIPEIPASAEGHFKRVDGFVFDVRLPFTRERWRGRIRACRGVGAAFSDEEITEFDKTHAQLLERTTPPEFTILHRVDCFVLQPC